MAITAKQAAGIRARHEKLAAWMNARKVNSYHPSELPADINPPSDDELSACEVFEFMRDKPERYFLYIKETAWNGPGNVPPIGQEWIATTWTGESLGTVFHGKPYRDNLGGTRIPVTVKAVNGCTYHGTYYQSAGSYARVRKAKR